MRVVFVCKNDNANVAYTLQQCLLEVGVNALAIKTKPHKFGYSKQAIVVNSDEMKKEMEAANAVIFVHSKFMHVGSDLKGKIIGVFHTGSQYRKETESLNELFNRVGDVTFCGGDVLGLGAKNEVWLQAPVDTKHILPVYSRSVPGKIIIGHYPSAPNKGLEYIQAAIKRLRGNFEFRYSEQTVSWEKNLQRMSECDVYIGEMHLERFGHKLSAFGISALEAACLGKIVCNRFLHKPQYEKTFGPCAIHVTNTYKELASTLSSIIRMDDNQILKLKKASRDWVERCHSYAVVGTRIKKVLEGIKK